MIDSHQNTPRPDATLYIEPLLGIIAGLAMLLLAAALLVVWLLRGLLGFHYPQALLGLDRDGLLELLLITAQRCHDHVLPEVNCALPGAAALAVVGAGLVSLSLIYIAAISFYLLWLRDR